MHNINDYKYGFNVYNTVKKKFFMRDDPSHPLSVFLSMLDSKESKRQYPGRLQVFFNFLKIEGDDVWDQSIAFIKRSKKKPLDEEEEHELERQIIIFVNHEKERIKKEGLSPNTIRNYYKAIRLFCQSSHLSSKVEWKLVSKTLPRAYNAADDRAPTLEEIQKLLKYPDRRIRSLVLILVSSGIRIGAFETLRWKHVTPIASTNGEVGKILVYPGDREEYYSFLTPEAFSALKDWMNYRLQCGENITKDSFVMRDIWENDDENGISNPRPLNQPAITRILNRAWKAEKIRPSLPKGVKRHEFKSAHGFRKYFKTQAEQARIPSIKIELLMGHSLGISDSYAKFTEEQMLEDYLKMIDFLTVDQNAVLVSRVSETK
ncbi:MAG: tyrosine-type recombinase/integrase [Candidatus Nitrosocosmicus sp.]|nr:tyrosine-type recombinase/integrase [Candidatus Nitrosocosmicus sp.]